MFLGQVRLVPYPNYGYRLGQSKRCWQTDNGGTLCEDGAYYLPN